MASLALRRIVNRVHNKRNLWRYIVKTVEKCKPMPLDNHFIELCGIWPEEERIEFMRDMKVYQSFISDKEEGFLYDEVENYMKRLRYEFDHWDDAIHGFRETERRHWYPHNRVIINRIKDVSYMNDNLPYVHVLDLAQEGVIKPHVDSIRYCGNIIAGLSLLSDCVMRLVRTDPNINNEEDISRHLPQIRLKDNFYANIFLPRRSLYVMKDTARYNFTHEILSNETSQFRGQSVPKRRRISIICRSEP